MLDKRYYTGRFYVFVCVCAQIIFKDLEHYSLSEVKMLNRNYVYVINFQRGT